MDLKSARLEYKPKVCEILKNILNISKVEEEKIPLKDNSLKKIFLNTYNQKLVSFKKDFTKKEEKNSPLKIAVVFSGGPAPGGHNVISAIFDSLKFLNEKSKIFGFLNGCRGIIDNNYIEITKDLIDKYRNMGGFDLIGSGRDKIEKLEDMEKALNSAKKLDLDGIVIIGGDDSNTNAALLAEYFLEKKFLKTKIVGVPKTIDGDLKNEYILTSFGFDTASKIYSELISNLSKDAISSKKYYHFIKVMGRSASHLALQCAMKTHPNLVFIGEEIEKKKKTLFDITQEIVDMIVKRAKISKNYGTIVIPEGLIEFIPEMKNLIKEINSIIFKKKEEFEDIEFLSEKVEYIKPLLPKDVKETFILLPESIKEGLLSKRDPHGNVQLSKIETEKLLIEKVKEELLKREKFSKNFNPLSHFFGYEGRAAMPSNFDADYCYSLGIIATILIKENLSGYMACVKNLNLSFEKWIPLAIPIVSLMHMEERKGKKKPVIKKALVDLEKKAFLDFKEKRDFWKMEDDYLISGPIQYFGEKQITDLGPQTMFY